MTQETETFSLSQQIDEFAKKYLENKFFSFLYPQPTVDLEKLLLPVGFKPDPEHSVHFYLHEKKDGLAELFSVKNLFENLFETHNYTLPIDWKMPERHYLSLTQLVNPNEADQLMCKYHHLHHLWNEEGMTHRGFGNAEIIKPYWKNVGVQVIGIFSALAGVGATGLCSTLFLEKYFPDNSMNVAFVSGAALLGGLAVGGICAYKQYHHLAKTDQTRQELKSQYDAELKQFREKYESRTVFDQTALENAVGFNKNRSIPLF